MTNSSEVTFGPGKAAQLLSLGLSIEARITLSMLVEGHDLLTFCAERGVEVESFPFFNGRERMIGLKLNPKRSAIKYLYVVFGNSRSSDEMVLYRWEGPLTLNPPTVDAGDLTDEAWKNRRHFKCGDYHSICHTVLADIEEKVGEWSNG